MIWSRFCNMKKIITGIIIAVLFFAYIGYAGQDIITDLNSESGIAMLNEELRKLNKLYTAATAPTDATYITKTADSTLSAEQALGSLSTGILKVTTTTGVVSSLGDPLPIANGGTGQDTAQEAIDALLPSQTGNSGEYLTTDGTNSSWGAVSTGQLSNVIFCWNGSEYWVNDVGGLYSSETSLTLDPGIAKTYGYEYFAVVGTTYRNILISKFKKIAGDSTITIQARLWSDSADAGEETILNVDVGGQANTVKSVTSSTPAWVTAADIDVSSLTNGTTYDITIQLKNEGAGGISYCSAVILIAS